MVHSHPRYRLYLVILFVLTFIFLTAAIITLQRVSSPNTGTPNQTGTPQTGLSNHNQIVKSVNTNIRKALIQPTDLQQFNRALHEVSLSRSPQNDAEQPIPYFLEEDGQNSIIYFHGEVNIKCWLALSNGDALSEQCH